MHTDRRASSLCNSADRTNDVARAGSDVTIVTSQNHTHRLCELLQFFVSGSHAVPLRLRGWLGYRGCLVSFPGVPSSQNLTRNLRRIRPWNSFELPDSPCEAVGNVEIPELIGSHPVRAAEPTRLSSWSAPAIEIVAVQIEPEDSIRGGVPYPDEPVLVNEVIHHECGLAGRPVRRTQRPHVEELAVLVEHLHPLMPTIDDEEPAVGAGWRCYGRC
jgi:hypothetical protein